MLCVRDYKGEYKQEIEKLISDDSFVREDILGCLERFSECGKVVEDNGEIIAVGVFTGNDKKTSMTLYVKESRRKGIGSIRLDGAEIDGVAVAIEEQGKGYGTALVGYAINKILYRKYKKVSLWAVEGNLAKYLYSKLGFKTERKHEFVIKNIK